MPCWEPKAPMSLSGTSSQDAGRRAPQGGVTPTAVQTECDYCGSSKIVWRKCKLICEDCKQINKSCADL